MKRWDFEIRLQGVRQLPPGPLGTLALRATSHRRRSDRPARTSELAPGEAAWGQQQPSQPRLRIQRGGATLDIQVPGDATWRGPKAQTDGAVQLSQHLQPSEPPQQRPWYCRAERNCCVLPRFLTHRIVNIIKWVLLCATKFWGGVLSNHRSLEHRAILNKAAGPSSRHQEEARVSQSWEELGAVTGGRSQRRQPRRHRPSPGAGK